MNRSPLTTVDLFAGSGGLSLGLKQAGWDIVCAVERSPIAAETYFANFVSSRKDVGGEYAEHLAKAIPDQVRAGLLVNDVRVFEDYVDTVRELLNGGDLGLLAGGPPCQGFSLAGRRSPDDPRNDLVWNFLKITELLSPIAVLMENVDAIQADFGRAKRGGVLADLEDALEETTSRHGGYAVARLCLRADHYGVPQRRKRVFLIGVRKDIASTIGIPDRGFWDSEKPTLESLGSPVAPAATSARAPRRLNVTSIVALGVSPVLTKWRVSLG